jgi:hypothetical protein
LANFDFEVLYRPGVKNQAADAMSRLLTSASHLPEPIDEIPVLVVMVTDEEENDVETAPDDDAPHPVIPDRGPRVRVPDEGLTPISFDEIHEEQLCIAVGSHGKATDSSPGTDRRGRPVTYPKHAGRRSSSPHRSDFPT